MAHVIRVVDFETTGIEPPAEVVEVGYCDLSQAGPGAPWIVDEPVSRLCGVAAIPPEVRAVHWIRHSEVAGLPQFDPAAFVEEASGCAAIAAHNMDFENAWLGVDGVMPLICTLKAAYRVWPEAPGHSNSVLRCWLEDRGLIALTDALAEPPHRAGPDAYVTAHILAALLTAGATGKDMVAWTREPRLLPIINFGKHRGTRWPDAPRDYLEWLLRSDMDGDTKWNAQRELDRRRTGVAA